MPVTNNYVVKFLLNATTDCAHPLRWRELSSGAFAAAVHGIRVRLTHSYSKAGSFLFLSISRAGHRTQIEEPHPSGFIRRSYDTPQDLELSDLMRALETEIRRQWLARQQFEESHHEQIHRKLVDQLIFGVPAKSAVTARQR